MESIVLELQKDAMDNSIPVSALVRKAYIIAKKLGISEFEKWVHSELNGYEVDKGKIPSYRKIQGDIRGWNPYHGWIPVVIENEKVSEILSNNKIAQPITDIEILANSEGNCLSMKFSQKVQNQLSKGIKMQTNFELQFNKEQMKSILEAVRNIVLGWALKLEEDGIKGYGLTFSAEEKEMAKEKNYNIYNYYGDINNSQIQQNPHHSVQFMDQSECDIETIKHLINWINENLESFGLEREKVSEICSELSTLKVQIESPKPKGAILKEGLNSLRSIFEGVSGNLLASGILYEIAKILGN